MKLRHLVVAYMIGVPALLWAQGNFTATGDNYAMTDNEPRPVFPIPAPRQLVWQQTEFYAFFHFGMNTFTGQEWGNGDKSETTFAPTAVPNPEQWLSAVQSAGMRGGIAVVKHHDGFCLWPTKTTTHSVEKASGYGQQTNIPRDFAAAAQKLGMKYGFYVSPWDRNSGKYGTAAYITDVFLPQVEELAKYGSDQFEMWFDGANGGSGYYGGKNTTITVDRPTYYDVPNLRYKVHQICPNCVLWGVGGEARWIGNESGYAGVTNWLTDNRLDGQDQPHAESGTEDGWFWLPGESDAKATSGGWFWHNGESPTSAERLFQMYLETVGRNATLILNYPPNRDGVLPEADVTVLGNLGTLLKTRLGVDVVGNTSTAAVDYAKEATIQVSNTRTAGGSRNYGTSNLTDGNWNTYWATQDGTTSATITLTWDEAKTIRYVQLMEYVKLGQRIQDFDIEYSTDGSTFSELASDITTTVGYKRIIPLNGSTSASYGSGYQAKAVRIKIKSSKACPTLSNISIF